MDPKNTTFRLDISGMETLNLSVNTAWTDQGGVGLRLVAMIALYLSPRNHPSSWI
jgi:hypothetical protein